MFCLFVLRKKCNRRSNPRKVYAITDEDEAEIDKFNKNRSSLTLSQLMLSSKKSGDESHGVNFDFEEEEEEEEEDQAIGIVMKEKV